jgi:LDH2 family malate/lactate/ureidoglycolate dehydrogenase
MAFGPNVGSHEAHDRLQEVAHFALALDPSAFLPLDRFKARVDSLIDQIHAVPKASDVDRVYVPGERGFLLAREREREGIPLSARRLSELRRVAEQVGVAPLPEPPA